MIKSIRVVNPSEEFLDLDLETSHIETGIYIKQITGIGPEKASINTTALAMEDGGVFNSARADVRNIVLTLGFYESPTLHNSIEDSRHLTYKFFPKKKKITLEFYTDNRDSFIQGYVESNEPDIFSKEESTQISVICPDPNFYSLANHRSVFGGINAKFQFPFYNDTVDAGLSVVSGIPIQKQFILDILPAQGIEGFYYYVAIPSTPGYYQEWVWCKTRWYQTFESKKIDTAELIMGEIEENSVNEVYYEGDADSGMIMTIHFLGEAKNITVYNVNTGESITLNTEKIKAITEYDVTSGDDIILTTMPSSKSIVYRHGGISKDILNAINRDDFDHCWFKLSKGINEFSFSADEGFDKVQIYIDAYVAYNGV